MGIWPDSMESETDIRTFSGNPFRWQEMGRKEEAEGPGGRERTSQRGPNCQSAMYPGRSPQQCDPSNSHLPQPAQGLAFRRHSN